MHMESIHYVSGATCADCHMPLDSKSAVPYDIRNHSLSVTSYGTYDYTCGQAIGCHQDQGSDWAAEMVEFIQTDVEAGIELAHEAFLAANATIYAAMAEGASEAEIAEAEELLLEAESHLTFVDSDGSHGFHNPQYALSLLAKSVNFAREAEATASEVSAEIATAQITELHSEAKSLESEVSSLESENSSLESEKDDLESDVNSLTSEVSTLESQVSGLEADVADLQTKSGGTTNYLIGAVIGLILGAVAVFFLKK